uniref:Uncharacterized protein n=1 Tax=Anguilla anguilla TaxID=7936 RepID=A0A0E9QCU8_ANGAN
MFQLVQCLLCGQKFYKFSTSYLDISENSPQKKKNNIFYH